MTDRKAAEEPAGLFTFSIATGEKRRLILPSAKSMGDTGPAVSPDGRLLAFSRSPSYAVSDLWVLSLSEDLRAKGEPRQLTFDHRQVFGCASTTTFTPKSQLYSTSEGFVRAHPRDQAERLTAFRRST